MSLVGTMNGTEKLDPLTCPHCNTGIDGMALGLFWDPYEKSWRCITCGHRTFERRKKHHAELLEDMLWDRVLATFEQEEKQNHPGDEGEDFEEELLEVI